MARITVEDCLEKVDNQYDLVLLAKERTMQLNSGSQMLVDEDNDKKTVIALREIADTAISKDEMKENLIQEYQTISINDEELENQELQPQINTDESTEDTQEISKEDLSTKVEVEQEMNELIQLLYRCDAGRFSPQSADYKSNIIPDTISIIKKIDKYGE